jgi:polyhydroxyalkanoate synthesis regulator phasin
MILDPALSVARRGALAYVGAIALTSDFVSTTIEKFAKRGTTAQQAALEQFKATIRRLRPESAPKPEGEQVAKAEQMLAQRRDQLLSALNIPTQSTLHSLNAQVDHLSAAIDELRTQARRAKTEPPVAPAAEPLPGYDKMNVDTVVSQLSKFDETGLKEVRAYEQAHGKRVTVLRAIDERLAIPVEA